MHTSYPAAAIRAGCTFGRFHYLYRHIPWFLAVVRYCQDTAQAWHGCQRSVRSAESRGMFLSHDRLLPWSHKARCLLIAKMPPSLGGRDHRAWMNALFSDSRCLQFILASIASTPAGCSLAGPQYLCPQRVAAARHGTNSVTAARCIGLIGWH